MSYKNMCNTQKIIDEILKKFELQDEPYNRGSIRKKITALSKKIPATKNGVHTNLWDKTRIQLDGRNKAEHIFNEKEKNIILNHHELKSYILKYLSVNSEELEQRLKREVEEEKKYIKAAEKTNKNNEKLLNGPTAEELFTPDEYAKMLEEEAETYIKEDEFEFYSREDAHQEKLFLMVEALFLKFFTPIDEEQLYKDMNNKMLDGSLDIYFTPEIMKSIERYNNKDYYKPLDKSNK